MIKTIKDVDQCNRRIDESIGELLFASRELVYLQHGILEILPDPWRCEVDADRKSHVNALIDWINHLLAKIDRLEKELEEVRAERDQLKEQLAFAKECRENSNQDRETLISNVISDLKKLLP